MTQSSGQNNLAFISHSGHFRCPFLLHSTCWLWGLTDWPWHALFLQDSQCYSCHMRVVMIFWLIFILWKHSINLNLLTAYAGKEPIPGSRARKHHERLASPSQSTYTMGNKVAPSRLTARLWTAGKKWQNTEEPGIARGDHTTTLRAKAGLEPTTTEVWNIIATDRVTELPNNA